MLYTKQKENNHRSCYNPDCNELGVYPAPKSKENLREYLYFCINCIREFNKSWNYFEGLNEQELEIEIRKSTTWNRPSWKFGTKNLNYDFEKAFRQFNEQKKPDENNNVSKSLQHSTKLCRILCFFYRILKNRIIYLFYGEFDGVVVFYKNCCSCTISRCLFSTDKCSTTL